MPSPKIFLTGGLGAGKTTVIVKAVKILQRSIPSLILQGFYTPECGRARNGKRLGEDIVKYYQGPSGSSVVRRVPLARVVSPTNQRASPTPALPRVGNFSVMVDNVQNHMVPTLLQQPPLLSSSSDDDSPASLLTVIDGVGPMELLCQDFFPAVWNHLDTASNPTVGTLHSLEFPIREVEQVVHRPDVRLLLVTRKNRNQLAKDLAAYLLKILLNKENEDGYAAGDVKSILAADAESILDPYQYWRVWCRL